MAMIALLRWFETKRTIRCGDFVESQYYNSGKDLKEKRRGDRTVNVDICYFCGCSEDLARIDEIKTGLGLTSGKIPLPL